MKKTNEALIKDLIDVNANRLIMGGIIALINKNTGDDEHLEARIKDLGIENNTTKNRFESLESWMVKQEKGYNWYFGRCPKRSQRK